MADRRLNSLLGTGGSRNLACIVDGTARPARPRQGVGADRSGDRTRVLACPAGRGGVQAGGGAAVRTRSSHSGWFAVPTGRAATRNLLVQACTGTGRGLRHAAARAETCASCSNRRNPRKSVRGDHREPTRAVGGALDPGGTDRESRAAVGQSGTALGPALGAS